MWQHLPRTGVCAAMHCGYGVAVPLPCSMVPGSVTICMGAGMVSLGVSAGVISVGAGAGMGSGALAGSGYPGGPLDHALVPGMVRWVPGSVTIGRRCPSFWRASSKVSWVSESPCAPTFFIAPIFSMVSLMVTGWDK